jgi:hypothetical protein
MDSVQAKEVLRLYRPGTTDAQDPRMAEALQAIQSDPELARWFEEHCAVYIAIRTKLKQIEIPPDLKRNILLENLGRSPRIISLWRHPAVWAAAAAFAALAAGTWLLFLKPAPQIGFEKFEEWRVSEVQRGYKMKPATSLTQINTYLETNHGIVEPTLAAKPLGQLPVEGFATTPWQGRRVTMLCFNGGKTKDGKDKMLYFFVANRADFPGSPAPGAKPQFRRISHLNAASWSSHDKVYILAGPGDDSDLDPYLD